MNIYIDITHEYCCACGCSMFMPAEVVSKLRETKKTFYCLNGHAQSYTKSLSDTLREELNKTKKELSCVREQLYHAKEELTERITPIRRRAKRT